MKYADIVQVCTSTGGRLSTFLDFGPSLALPVPDAETGSGWIVSEAGVKKKVFMQGPKRVKSLKIKTFECIQCSLLSVFRNLFRETKFNDNPDDTASSFLWLVKIKILDLGRG